MLNTVTPSLLKQYAKSKKAVLVQGQGGRQLNWTIFKQMVDGCSGTATILLLLLTANVIFGWTLLC